MSVLNILPLGDKAGFAKSAFGGMDTFELIENLSRLGKDRKGIEEILSFLDVDINDNKIVSALSNIGTQTLSLTSSFQNLGETAKNAFSGLWSFIKSNWKLLAIITAIGAAVKITDALITTPQEYAQAIDEAFSNFSEAQSEVEALNSELATTKDRIADLQAKGSLSFVEKSELAKLKETQKTLEIQADLAERTALTAAKHASSSAINAYRAAFDKDISGVMTDFYMRSNTPAQTLIADESNISAMIAGVKKYSEYRDKATNTDDWQLYDTYVKQTTASIWEQAKLLSDYQADLESVPEQYRGSYENDVIRQIKSQVDYIYKELDPETWKQMKLDDIFSDTSFANMKKDLVDLAKASDNVGISAEDIPKRLAVAAKSAGIEIQELVDEINSEAGIIDFAAVKQQLKDSFMPDADNKFSVAWQAEFGKFSSWVHRLSDEDLKLTYKIMLEADTSGYTLEDWQYMLEYYRESLALESPLDLDAERTGIESVTSAINEAASATGLTSASVKTLSDRYEELEGYNPEALFENTATGVRLNTAELNKLEDAYVATQKLKTNEYLADLAEEYETLSEKAEKFADTAAGDDYKARADAILDEIEKTKQLISEYEGLTNAYAEWLNAQATTQHGAWYDSALESYKSLKELYTKGYYGDTSLQEGLEYFTGREITSLDASDRITEMDAAYKQLTTTITGTSYSLNSFMQEGNTGINNFLKALQQTNEEWAEYDYSTGTWELGELDLDAIADQFGTSAEFIDMMIDRLRLFGFEVNTVGSDVSLDELNTRLRETQALLTEAGYKDVGLEEIVNSVDDTLSTIGDTIKSINDSDLAPEVKTDKLEDWYELADEAVRATNQPAFMNIDVSSVSENLQEPLQLVQQYQEAVNTANAAKIKGLDTTAAEQNIQNLLNQIAQLDAATLEGLGFKLEGVDAGDLSEVISDQIPYLEVPVKLTAEEAGLEPLNIEPQRVDVIYDRDSTDVDEYIPKDHYPIVEYQLESSAVDSFNPPNLSRTVTYTIQTVGGVGTSLNGFGGFGAGQLGGIHGLNGTAHASGTANAGGNCGAKTGGEALVGEIKPEIMVDPQTGTWQTIGDHGAEFVDVPKGAIIFNHKQTEALLKNGYVNGRGKPTGGTALASGTTPTVIYKAPSNDSNNSTDNTEFYDGLEKIDWAEVAIERIEAAIDRIATAATSAFKTLEKKLKSSGDQVDLLKNEIEIQIAAYERYMKEAESVELTDRTKDQIKNGSIDVSYYDEDGRERIGQYQEYYEKAMEAADAVAELKESLAELYEENFNAIQDDFDNQIELLEHMTNSYENGLDQLEAQGYLASGKYYEELKKLQQNNIDILNNELNSLTTAFSEAMASGEIEEGSESWYEMQSAINGVKEQIDEANLALIEYSNTMRELEWEQFDYAQERIARLTDESEFLIDLLDNDDLYDDKGKLNESGNAVAGLHGMNYNVYMAQADMYAEELKKINKELADDPNNTKLIERKEELLDLQQDSIIAAEDEKQAIIDMVEEGIDLELDSLQDLIDTYTEALDSAKDLYDYQKKIEDHTSEISSLQKQLTAYENDDSEETRAKKQELSSKLKEAQEGLEETEYEQYIDDQKKLLDDLYLEYETILNQRLDNTDALLAEMIDSSNADSAAINATLAEAADNVGYTLTENMQSIWDGSTESIEGTMSIYGDGFNEKLTSINDVLDHILNGVYSIAGIADESAADKIKDTSSTTTPVEVSVRENAYGAAIVDPIEVDIDYDNEKSSSGGSGSDSSGSGGSGGNGAPKPSGQQSCAHSYKSTLIAPTETSGGYTLHYCQKCGDQYKTNPTAKRSAVVNKIINREENDMFPKFASGGLADFTGLAQVDGTKNKPELVLNPQDTANFIELNEFLRDMANRGVTLVNRSGIDISHIPNIAHNIGLSDITSVLARIRESANGTVSNSIGDINITIPIEHVEDYNDFVNQLRNDSKFEKMIEDITIGKIVGGSTFAKNKYKW